MIIIYHNNDNDSDNNNKNNNNDNQTHLFIKVYVLLLVEEAPLLVENLLAGHRDVHSCAHGLRQLIIGFLGAKQPL